MQFVKTHLLVTPVSVLKDLWQNRIQKHIVNKWT